MVPGADRDRGPSPPAADRFDSATVAFLEFRLIRHKRAT